VGFPLSGSKGKQRVAGMAGWVKTCLSVSRLASSLHAPRRRCFTSEQCVHSCSFPVFMDFFGYFLLSLLTWYVSSSTAGRSCSRTGKYWLCGRGAADNIQHKHYQSDRPQLHRESLCSPWTDLSRDPDADAAPGSSEESATRTVTPGSAPYESYE